MYLFISSEGETLEIKIFRTSGFVLDSNRPVLGPIRKRVSLMNAFYELPLLFSVSPSDHSLNTNTLTSSLTSYSDSSKPAKKPQE